MLLKDACFASNELGCRQSRCFKFSRHRIQHSNALHSGLLNGAKVF